MKRFMIFCVCFDNEMNIQGKFRPKTIDKTSETVFNQVKRLTFVGG